MGLLKEVENGEKKALKSLHKDMKKLKK